MFGWLSSICLSIGLAALWLLVGAFVHLDSLSLASENWMRILKLLTVEPTRVMLVVEGLAVLALAWIAAEKIPVLTLSWRYPRSRQLLADGAFLSRLTMTLSFVLVISILLTVQAGAAALLGEGAFDTLMQPLLRWLAVLLISMPLAQWMRGGAGDRAVPVLGFFFFLALTIVVSYLLGLSEFFRHDSWYWLLGVLALTALTQGLSWWGLRRHFRNADLV